MYLSGNSRPDIQSTVHQWASFTNNLIRSHDEAVNRICHYLVVTQGQGVTFVLNSDMKLDYYVDADFAGLWKHEDDQDTVYVKSRNGYVINLGGCPLH